MAACYVSRVSCCRAPRYTYVSRMRCLVLAAHALVLFACWVCRGSWQLPLRSAQMHAAHAHAQRRRDIIQDAWSPCHNICTILQSIQSLLTGAPSGASRYCCSETTIVCCECVLNNIPVYAMAQKPKLPSCS